jgi:hypothetical protein
MVPVTTTTTTTTKVRYLHAFALAFVSPLPPRPPTICAPLLLPGHMCCQDVNLCVRAAATFGKPSGDEGAEGMYDLEEMRQLMAAMDRQLGTGAPSSDDVGDGGDEMDDDSSIGPDAELGAHVLGHGLVSRVGGRRC